MRRIAIVLAVLVGGMSSFGIGQGGLGMAARQEAGDLASIRWPEPGWS